MAVGSCRRLYSFPDEFKPNTKQEVLDFLRYNYYRHFNANRAPFGIFLHARWFDDFPFAFTVRQRLYACSIGL
jgi:hypothetical protein